ncbi:hypothetical protein KIN20_009094 [Parelaphostrongylus tenuis]|uniref:Aftiphilin clathrin-binding box domain-containing protein n=1 Tax=Parelaphostrongylus tenuis TaxID=148309 RepID=A0AAD5QJC7_PARTN|nr:hypothetical protein KIN20_009094 [Parelaphostrongylus tenuis]
MDFEAPPPFVGALDELPDVECDIRLTVDDEEEFSIENLEIPTDLPCTSSSVSPQISLSKQNPAKRDSNGDNGKCMDQYHSNSVINGLPDERERVRTSADLNFVAQEIKCEEHEMESVQVDESIEDEFGDFADFTGPNLEASETKEPGPSESSPQEAFSDDSPLPGQGGEDNQPIWPTTVQESGEDDDWNAFGSLQEYKDGENWPTDFDDPDKSNPEVVDNSSSDSYPVASTAPISETVTSPVLEDLCASVDLWKVENTIGDDRAYSIINSLDSSASELEQSDGLPFLKGYELWLALRIVEDALALKFEWKGSQHRVNLFKTLGIDPIDEGRVSSSPSSMFTVLEPTPFTANSTTRRSVIISREEGGHDAKVVSTESPTCDFHSTATTTVPVESPSIPNADFDWEKSGLTNPTAAANRSSALLDVDFLWANSTGGNSSAISTLQKELDQLGLSNTMSQTRLKPENQPSMLDAVMASATKWDRKVIRPPSELSLDARALHDQLPDIDFLRASMIMFPIGEIASSDRELFSVIGGQYIPFHATIESL